MLACNSVSVLRFCLLATSDFRGANVRASAGTHQAATFGACIAGCCCRKARQNIGGARTRGVAERNGHGGRMIPYYSTPVDCAGIGTYWIDTFTLCTVSCTKDTAPKIGLQNTNCVLKYQQGLFYEAA